MLRARLLVVVALSGILAIGQTAVAAPDPQEVEAPAPAPEPEPVVTLGVPTSAAAAEPPPALPPVPVPTSTITPIPSAPPARDLGTWRTLGVVSGFTGVALVGAGVVLGLSARRASADVSQRYDPARAKEGERDETLSFVGFGLGAAAIVTGILLYAHGDDQPTVGMRAVPTLGTSAAGLSLGGTF